MKTLELIDRQLKKILVTSLRSQILSLVNMGFRLKNKKSKWDLSCQEIYSIRLNLPIWI